MSLDSTDISPKVKNDIFDNGQEKTRPEMKVCPRNNEEHCWCYIYTHSTKVSIITKKIEEKFNVFVHKTIIYSKKTQTRKINKVEKPTISGLVFIQGRPECIQTFLSLYFPGIYLVKDCSTGKPAIIREETMDSFMRLSEVEPTRLRFMPNPFEYYAEGHVLVKITSGPMAGMEGYIVRISRNRCLVISVGGLSVAISGIHKETFENIEEYNNICCGSSSTSQVSEILEEIYESFK